MRKRLVLVSTTHSTPLPSLPIPEM
jgi:hypothetical protein